MSYKEIHLKNDDFAALKIIFEKKKKKKIFVNFQATFTK